jgi:hypothetical protein
VAVYTEVGDEDFVPGETFEPMRIDGFVKRLGAKQGVIFELATTARNPIEDARTDEIQPVTAELAGRPDDWCWLFGILPFSPVAPDPIQDE